MRGGADIIMIETVFDTLNAKAAIYAIEEAFDEMGEELPIWISGTITDLSGRMLTGQTAEAFWHSVRHAKPFAIGLNCALGAKELRPYIAELAQVADTLVSAHPNAGLPNEFGGYDDTPEHMAELIGEFARSGLRQHRRRLLRHDAGPSEGLRRSGEGRQPRAVPEKPHYLRLSGLEPFTLTPETNFVNVGERTNITGSAKFRKLIAADDYEAALEVARTQVENGAQIIDVNMDEGLLDSEAAMKRFLCLIAAEPDIARVPVMIDTSKWSVIEEGLKVVSGQAHRQFHQHEGRRGELHRAGEEGPALRRRRGGHGVRRTGPGRHARRKVEICNRAYRYAGQQGRLPARRHHLRSQHLRGRHRHRGAQ